MEVMFTPQDWERIENLIEKTVATVTDRMIEGQKRFITWQQLVGLTVMLTLGIVGTAVGFRTTDKAEIMAKISEGERDIATKVDIYTYRQDIDEIKRNQRVLLDQASLTARRQVQVVTHLKLRPVD